MAVYEGDIGLYLSGQQINIPSCNIAITQPKISQIVMYGEDIFLQCEQLLGHCDIYLAPLREGNTQLEELSNFQLLLVMIQQDIETKNNLLDFFSLIMPEYEIKFTDNTIDCSIDKQIVGRMTPFNFADFQTVLNELFDPIYGKTKDEEFHVNPKNKKAMEIAEKLNNARQKRAQAKNKNGLSSMFGNYISILSIGMNININTLYAYTPFQLFDTFNRYQAKVQSDLYQKIATTPLMDVSAMKEPESWLRDFYNSVSSRPGVNANKELVM